jgi:hypothetical protein
MGLDHFSNFVCRDGTVTRVGVTRVESVPGATEFH